MTWLRGGIVLLVLVTACAPRKPTAPEAPPAAPGDEATAGPRAAVADVAPVPPAEPEESWLGVRTVNVERSGGGRRVSIGLTRAPTAVKDFTLSGPPRVVIDLTGADVARN